MGRYHYQPNDALVIHTGAEREIEESTGCRCSVSNDTGIFLSGGYCGEDEFLSKEAVRYRIGTEIMIYCVYVN